MTKFLNISTDGTLAGNSDETVVSEKAIKTYADTKQAQLVSGTNIKTVNGNSLLGSGDITISGSVAWGNVTGTLSNQTDLASALNGKSDTDFSNVSATGKETATKWGLPDYDNPISISTFNSSNPYTAPKDGLFKAVTGQSCELYVNGAEAYYGGTTSGYQAWAMTAFVSKGDIITTDVGSTVRPEFYPLKGVA